MKPKFQLRVRPLRAICGNNKSEATMAIGITSQMVPPAVENIKNLLITTIFMAACKEFDTYLTEHKVQGPAVLMSDEHSSRYDFDTLKDLLSKQIWLFISPLDTTGVTQLLDQMNKNLHHEYHKAKDYLLMQCNV